MSRLAVIVLAVAAMVTACGDGGDDDRVARAREEQARRVARDAGLPTDVENFLARAAAAAGEEYTVEYAVKDEDNQRVTLRQDPPARRIDVTVIEGTNETVRSIIVNDDGTFSCGKDEKGWQCTRAPSQAAATGPFALADIQRTVQALTAARDAYDLAVEDRELAATAATCLVTTLRPGQPVDPERGDRGELCISPEGAPLLVEQGGQSLRAIQYRPEVGADAFELPAPPSTTTTARGIPR